MTKKLNAKDFDLGRWFVEEYRRMERLGLDMPKGYGTKLSFFGFESDDGYAFIRISDNKGTSFEWHYQMDGFRVSSMYVCGHERACVTYRDRGAITARSYDWNGKERV